MLFRVCPKLGDNQSGFVLLPWSAIRSEKVVDLLEIVSLRPGQALPVLTEICRTWPAVLPRCRPDVHIAAPAFFLLILLHPHMQGAGGSS